MLLEIFILMGLNTYVAVQENKIHLLLFGFRISIVLFPALILCVCGIFVRTDAGG